MSFNSFREPNTTAQKLAIMKFNAGSEPISPSPAAKMANGASSRSMARSSRTVNHLSKRRSSSFIASHRNEMSRELTTQAESKFFALVDLMASASREAASLKELWGRIVAERESFNEEREQLLEQVTEVTQELEQRNTEQRQQGTDVVERKKQVDKLLLELSVAVQNVSIEKKRRVERDHELGETRRELNELKETYSRTHGEFEKFRTELESIQLLLKTAEDDRDSARGEANRYHRDLLKVTRERTEFSSKLTDITTKHKHAREEVRVLSDRVNTYDLEFEKRQHEYDQLREEFRKARARAEESAKELLGVTEKYERVEREYHQVKEVVRVVELERDDHFHTIESLRRDLETTTTARNQAEQMRSDLDLKYEHVKRELLSVREKFHDIETECSELTKSLDESREQLRVIIIERDGFKDEADVANRKADDQHRRLLTMVEILQKTESTLNETRSDCYTLTERIKSLDRELDDRSHQAGGRQAEIVYLEEKIVAFQAEIRTITEARNRLQGELEKSRAEFEEVTEEMTTYDDGTKELQFEIESLRTLLREAREQKERAITARNSADRERDEYVAKYEEKCRELERFEESAASRYHALARSSEGHTTTTTSRIVSSRSNAARLSHGGGR